MHFIKRASLQIAVRNPRFRRLRYMGSLLSIGLVLALTRCSMPYVLPTTTEAQPAEGPGRLITSESKDCKDPALASQIQGKLQLTLVHGNRVIPVRPGSHITISHPRFALLFNMAEYDLFCDRFTAARVMASQNADFIEGIVTPPFQIKDTSYLGAGWSMATDLSMRYDTLFLTEGGMHYLILNVQGEPIEQRLSIQRVLGPGLYQMRWDIFAVARTTDDSLKYLGEDKTTFAMLFFRDSDLDEIVETGEFMVFYITIAPDRSN